MAATLAWAALEKARNLPAVSDVIRLLGCPEWLCRPAALGLVMTEIGVALGLSYDWGSLWTRTALALLAVTFAAAGAWVLWKGKSVRCDCFGLGSGGALGLKQIMTLPLWLLGIGLLSLQPHTPSLEYFGQQLAAVGLCLAGLRIPAVVRAQREAFGDRRSAQETYVWLP
jgi:hypothetical protein